jgi:hypothetical protein
MADIVGHPWMQGEHASAADVKQEFAIRHQRVIEMRQAEAEKNKADKQKWAAQRGVRRGDRIGDKVYLDLETDATSEESKDPTVQKKLLQACKFEFRPDKHTQFFSTYETTYVFTKLVEYLKDHQIKYSLSDKFFKIEFEAEKMPDKVEDGTEEEKTDGMQAPVETVQGKIEIQKVNETTVCVDFTRKAGSSWLFYEKFNFIHVDLAELSDAQYTQ